MKTACLLLLTTLLLSCKEKTSAPEDLLQNGSWKVALKDNNPLSNPGSSVTYYAWKACQQDDIYTFRENKLTIEEGAISCETPQATVLYQYDQQTRKLTIGETVFTVAELNENYLKYYVQTPAPSGFSYLVYIFEKK